MSQTPQEPSLSVFLASSVHDMKNSVSMLSASLEKMLGELDPASFPGYQQMAHMLFEVNRVNGNLTQLLALYKLGERRYPFQARATSLPQFALEIESQCRPLLDSRTIQLYIDCPPGAIWHFDEDLINGVVTHAINNAIRYTYDKIRLAFEARADTLTIRIEDNGSGFPATMLTEPGATGVDFRTGSTGLGLHFAREVAALHHHDGRQGSVRLENGGALGGGCFILELP
jgi:signal transduction histidine kinase